MQGLPNDLHYIISFLMFAARDTKKNFSKNMLGISAPALRKISNKQPKRRTKRPNKIFIYYNNTIARNTVMISSYQHNIQK